MTLFFYNLYYKIHSNEQKVQLIVTYAMIVAKQSGKNIRLN